MMVKKLSFFHVFSQFRNLYYNQRRNYVLSLKLFKDTNKKNNTGEKSNQSNFSRELEKQHKNIDQLINNQYLENKKNLNISIVGGGYIAVNTTILLKQNPSVSEIRLINTDDTICGPTSDIKQIDTSPAVKYYKQENILDGLKSADIVAVMDEKYSSLKKCEPFSQFAVGSNYVKHVAESIASACPFAIIAVFAQPITSMVPLISEIFKCCGIWNPNKVLGCATVESMQISAITASFLNLNPSCVSIPITGGIDSLTVTPLLSNAEPFYNFTLEEKKMLTDQFRSVDDNIRNSELKVPLFSSSMGAAKFLSALINGITEQNISIISAYMKSDILSCHYLTSKVKLGPSGVEQNFGLPKVSKYEIYLIKQVTPIIQKMIDSAINFARTGRAY